MTEQDEPEYITWQEPWSGRDVRPDFAARMAGTMVTCGKWRCRRCHVEFTRRKPCAHHMLDCPQLWLELNDNDMALSIRAAWALFQASQDLTNRMKPDSFDQRIKNTGAEIACARMLQASPLLKPAHRAFLEQWDPRRNIGTFGKVPDLPIPGTRGIDVRQSDTDDLIVRLGDRKDRFACKIVGEFPRYGFAGWAIPAEVENIERYRKTYGYDNLDPCYGLPRIKRNYQLEALIEAL